MEIKENREIGCRGVRRQELSLDDSFYEEGEVVWMEINKKKGMNNKQIVNDIEKEEGIYLDELLSWMMEEEYCLS